MRFERQGRSPARDLFRACSCYECHSDPAVAGEESLIKFCLCARETNQRCFASLNMTASVYELSSTEKLARSREKFDPIHIPVAVSLVAAGVQDYLAVPDFSARDTILIGILNHVTS